jgi:plastocyanin
VSARRGMIPIAVGCAALVATMSCFSDRASITDTPDDSPPCEVPGFAIGSDHAVVFVRRFEFFPDTVRVRPGMTVTWVNCEESNVEPHTSTSETDVWDSGAVAPGETYSQTFGAAGSFGYFCRPHPFMRGVVLVAVP